MTHQLKPITITPEQMIAAAQKIVNSADDAWQYSEAQILQAVERWLMLSVSDLLTDADWYARTDGFTFDNTYSASSVPDEAKEVEIPPAPHWAKANGEIIQRRQPLPDENGDIIYA